MTATEHFVNPPRVPHPGGTDLCRLCAGDNAGCCRTNPDLACLSFPLSVPEWRRLKPYASLATPAGPAESGIFSRQETSAAEAAREFAGREILSPYAGEPPDEGDEIFAVEANVPDFIASLRTLFPGEKKRVASLFPTGGTHRTLRIRPDGACVFLGREGCRLPRKIRPWYCLLFPVWVIENSLTLFSSPDCLIAQKAMGPAHGVRLANARPAHLRALYASLRRDWELDSPV
jgi:Fe-S-cluster containining protein